MYAQLEFANVISRFKIHDLLGPFGDAGSTDWIYSSAFHRPKQVTSTYINMSIHALSFAPRTPKESKRPVSGAFHGNPSGETE